MIISTSVRNAEVYTHWHEHGIFDVGLSYGPEGIVIVYREKRRSYYQFLVEGKQYRYWVEPSPTKSGLVRIARNSLREIIKKAIDETGHYEHVAENNSIAQDQGSIPSKH